MLRSISMSAFALIMGVVMNSSAAGPSPKSSGHGLLLVANKGEHTLGLAEPDPGRQLAAIPEGGITGHEVIASPDGRTAYVPIYGNSGVGKPGTDGQTLAVIDIATRKLIHTIDFGWPVRPHCAKFGPKNGMLYISAELADSIDIFDPRTQRIVGAVPTGQPESHMFTITRDGKRAYTANVGPGTVSAIDLEAKKVLAVIPISKETQRISLSVDDKFAFTADQTAPRLAVIDTATNKVKTWVALPASAYGTAPTADGRWLVVAMIGPSKVGVVNLKTMKLERTIDVPKAPQEVLIPPGSAVAYVSCDSSHKIAVINLKTWKVDKLIDAGRGADGLAWAVGN
ncbi:MAG: beta-propeller fold lactonase family protein [Terriglobia bacterium]